MSYEIQNPDKWIPRALLVDLGRGTLDAVRVGPLARLFRSENFVSQDSTLESRNFFTNGISQLSSEFTKDIINEHQHLQHITMKARR